MSKSVTFIGNGKMALALAKGLCETHTIEVIGRSITAIEEFESKLGTPIKKTLYSDADITNKTVLLCVKPANLTEIAPYLKGTAQALYSVLAGTPLCISSRNLSTLLLSCNA